MCTAHTHGVINLCAKCSQFFVHEFGNKVCGEAKNMELWYFRGNKRVWIRTGDDYSEILGKLHSGSTITLWYECSPGRVHVSCRIR